MPLNKLNRGKCSTERLCKLLELVSDGRMNERMNESLDY